MKGEKDGKKEKESYQRQVLGFPWLINEKIANMITVALNELKLNAAESELRRVILFDLKRQYEEHLKNGNKPV